MVDEGRYKQKFGFTWEHVLRPNTLIWIDLQRPGLRAVKNDRADQAVPAISAEQASAPQLVMVGVVDTVTTTASMSGGKPQRRITVQGRDAGKMLINAEIKNALAVSVIGRAYPELGIALDDIQIGQKSVPEMIEMYWERKSKANLT